MEIKINVDRKKLYYAEANKLIKSEKDIDKSILYNLDLLEKRLNVLLIESVNCYNNRILRTAFDVYEIGRNLVDDEIKIEKKLRSSIKALIKFDNNYKDLLNNVYKHIHKEINDVYSIIRRQVISQIQNIKLTTEE